MENYMLLGFAKVDISPEKSVEMVGYTRDDNKSRGIWHPLIAETAIWTFLKEKCCLVTIDHIGFMIEDANVLRDMIAKELNIMREKVMLCFSHTHSSVNVTDEPDYFHYLCDKVVSCVKEAEKNTEPVEIEWDCVEADIGCNRRDETGALDKRIGILKVVNKDTKALLLILLRVTAHANVLPYDNYLISSDYIGVTREKLEEKYGCSIMITQGAAGNVSARFSDSEEALYQMADSIATVVDESIRHLKPVAVERMEMYSTPIEFRSDLPTLDRAKEIKEEAFRENQIDGAEWLKEVERLKKNNVSYQTVESEIQYFHINEGCLCGVPNEIMCELALEVEKACNNKQVYFGAYTNGCTGYLPTAKEYMKGGFEVLHSYLIYYIYHGFVMPLNRESADKLTKCVVKNKRC